MTAQTTGIGARSAGETGSDEEEEALEEVVPTEHTEYTEAGIGKGESSWGEKAPRNP